MKKRLTILFIILSSFSAFSQSLKDTIKLREIEISSYPKSPYIKDIISDDKIRKSNAKDIGEFLKTVPNVSVVKKGGASLDPVIRGFRASQLNVILDNGIKIEGGCPNRMDPVTSHIEAENISRMEIIKGPFALRFGPNFGGIINLVTEKPKPYEKFEIHAKAEYGFETNCNGQREHIAVFGGGKKIFFSAGGGYKLFGSYKDGDNASVKSSFTKYDYSGKLGFTLNPKNKIMLSYISDHGRDVLYPALPMDEKSDDTDIYSIDYSGKNFSGMLSSLDIKLYLSEVNHVMDNSHRSNYPATDAVASVDAVNKGIRAEAGLKTGKGKLFIGADYENIAKDGERIMIMTMNMGGLTTKTTKKTNLWKDAYITNAGLFSEYKNTFGKYDLALSARLDNNSASSEDTLILSKDGRDYFSDYNSEYINFSASAALTRMISSKFSLSLALGRGVRSPNMLERYIKFLAVGYDNYDYLGNPRLMPEVNYEADLTVRYFNDRAGSFYLNGFFSRVQDFIGAMRIPPSVATPKTQGALGVKQFFNADYAVFRGFEFGYSSPLSGKMGIAANASYTKATICSMKKYLVENNQISGEVNVNNDALPEIPPLEGRVGLSYRFFSGRLMPDFSVRAVNIQNYTSEAFYEPHTPGFVLLDFSVNYSPFKIFSLNAGVRNILNKNYYEHLNRKIIGSADKLYEQGRSFFINMKMEI